MLGSKAQGYTETLKSWSFIPIGFTDIEGAKGIAKKLMETYDRDKNGIIDKVEIIPMMVDVYRAFNRTFNPGRGDIEAYYKILDVNGDGMVTIDDVEQICYKYLLPLDKKETNIKIFGSDISARLEGGKKIFLKYEKTGGFYTENEAVDLLDDAFKSMGIQTIFQNKDSIKTFISAYNTRNDGKLGIVEFENLLVKALKQAGYKVNE